MELSTAATRLLSDLLKRRTGQDLAAGRHWRIELALAPVARRHGFDTPELLAARLAVGDAPEVANEVVEALLNHETSFFRDAAAFDLLERRGLPRLADARADTRRLAVWCAGCATGQEAYSMAMLFAGDTRWDGWTIEIVGSDVSAAAIAAAQAGRYGHFEVQRGLPMRHMVRWFDREGESWRASAPLRARVRFVRRSLLEAPPWPGRFDLILCRNVLLYFAAAGRRAVLESLAAASAPDAVLMLGAGETTLGNGATFVSDYQARGLYRPAMTEGCSDAA